MYEARKKFAHHLADIAGSLVLKYFRQPLSVQEKEDSTPVTVADRTCEQLIRDELRHHFPDDGVVGEEFGKENEHAEFVWVIDPIDGTKSFIAGLPLFGVLIALLHQGKPLLGIIDQPYLKERWFGFCQEATLYNGFVVKTRCCKALSNAVLFSSADETMFADHDDKRRFNNLCKQIKTTRFSTDCYGYAMLSSGYGDIVCEADMKLYDYAALFPIVCGAGGVMTDWDANALFQEKDSGHVLALGDPSMLETVKDILKK